MKWNDHVNSIVKKAGKRLYMLRMLKRSNADAKILLTVYTTVIRPILEYASQVWHFNIPDYLCEEIEALQKRAFRIIAPSLSYSNALKYTNIPTLKERREKLCENFFKKNNANFKLQDILPNRSFTSHEFRNNGHYDHFLCKTDRFKNSFYHKVY